jgi:hypothetical protein
MRPCRTPRAPVSESRERPFGQEPPERLAVDVRQPAEVLLEAPRERIDDDRSGRGQVHRLLNGAAAVCPDLLEHHADLSHSVVRD